ncbi:DUF4179 domain-containing protein [Anaerovorax odorimutans]|uniref:DUF4179 domain-containing protein n=1 Tax=Anaerovorax odorimutans TaxID=109327 RepID=UPI000412AEBF|nr:DUF4179 domain-containing protein [Anaerovorax odorimutans]
MNNKKINMPDNSMEFLNILDDLDIEGTDKLLSGINKVTISYETEKCLKSKVCKKLGAEFLITQEEERKTVYNKNKKYIRRAIACIAAVMILSTAALAATNLDILQLYWGDDKEIYSDRSLETTQSVENENVKFNIEGVVSDKYQCVFILSMEALTKEGQKIIKNANKDISLALEIKPSFKDDLNHGSMGIFQYTDDNKNKNYKAYKCDFELKNVDLTKPVIIEFNGLSMNFNIPQYMQVITLYPDSASGFKSVDLSPIGYYYESEESADNIDLINKDGTLDDEMGYHGSMYQENNEKVMIIGSFTRLIDLDDYMGIQIDGIKYTKLEDQ